MTLDARSSSGTVHYHVALGVADDELLEWACSEVSEHELALALGCELEAVLEYWRTGVRVTPPL